MTIPGDARGNLLLQSLVEGATRVPATSEDLADAITYLVGRYSNELATCGMSAAEAGAMAVEAVAEVVGLAVE